MTGPSRADSARLGDVLVVLRATPDANSKRRPDWYDKRVCIRSIVRSAQVLREAGGRVRLLCLLDRAGGEPSAELREDLGAWDEVVEIDGGSARGSWQSMLDLLHRRRDLDYDTVYLVEDDHLHAPGALTALAQQDRDGFFLLYTHHFAGPAERVGDFDWRPATSGVSSFAVSRREFTRSFRVLRTMSNANQSWDDLTWHVLLGPATATGRFVLDAFSPDFGFPPWSPRALYNLAWRCAGWIWARLRRPSVAWAVDPNLATHVEIGQLAAGRDWPAVAGQIAADRPSGD